MAPSKSHHGVCPAIAIIVILGHCAGAWAVEFAGGTGEPNDPYQIATAEQLLAIGSDFILPNKHFVLVADIDLSGTTLSGPVVEQFHGSFDGSGHTIRNLRIRGVRGQGLFGYITGSVRNLGLLDVDIVSASDAGALAGQNSGGMVRDCYSTGTVAGMGYNAGGLIGSYGGTIKDSYSTAQVMGSSGVGGLVGVNAGVVSACHSAGTIIGHSAVGGLVGANGGRVWACYSTADVMGMGDAGGLVGSNTNEVLSSYSAGSVTGDSMTGGLVGRNSGRLFSCYSVASVADDGPPFAPSVGGLVGWRSSGSSVLIENCYFLTSADGGGPDNDIGTALRIAQMKQQGSYTGWVFWRSGLDDKGLWFMPADAFPVLPWQTETTGLQIVPDVAGLSPDEARAALTAAGFVPGEVTQDFCKSLTAGSVIHAAPYYIAPLGQTIDLVASSGGAYDWATNPGDGTSANPYQIQTAGQLESLGDHPEFADKCFILTANVDLAGRTYSTPVMNAVFTGTFDGQGHTIRNLTIAAAGTDYAGLFSVIDPAGQVSNLRVADAGIKASGSRSYNGVLAGYNKGMLTDCSVSGVIFSVCSSSNGLTGGGPGTLVNCYADVTVIRGTCPKR